jgi:hypothetical protein
LIEVLRGIQKLVEKYLNPVNRYSFEIGVSSGAMCGTS